MEGLGGPQGMRSLNTYDYVPGTMPANYVMQAATPIGMMEILMAC
jgi:hypothetical protein